MYKVVRLKNLKEVLYSESKSDIRDKVLSGCRKFTTEFIKCMEMYFIPGKLGEDNIPHWISGALGVLNLENKKLSYYSYSAVLSRVVSTPLMISDNEISKSIKSLYGKEFIRNVKKDIVNSRKYPSLASLNSFSYDDEYYSFVLSIFIMILNGKIDVDSIDTSSIWDISLNNIKIDVTSDKVKVRYSERDLRRLLSKFIFHLNSDSGYLLGSSFIN